jgi:hypothetical protein
MLKALAAASVRAAARSFAIFATVIHLLICMTAVGYFWSNPSSPYIQDIRKLYFVGNWFPSFDSKHCFFDFRNAPAREPLYQPGFDISLRDSVVALRIWSGASGCEAARDFTPFNSTLV